MVTSTAMWFIAVPLPLSYTTFTSLCWGFPTPAVANDLKPPTQDVADPAETTTSIVVANLRPDVLSIFIVPFTSPYAAFTHNIMYILGVLSGVSFSL